MNKHTRRDFITMAASAAGFLLSGRASYPFLPQAAGEVRPFEMLVVGDSLISAQGLREENKFYYLVKEWLSRDVFGTGRPVNLTVRAHSGARIDLHEDETEKMRSVGDDPTRYHHQEINLSFPTVRHQLDSAREKFGTPESVDLIVLSAGITDILVANTVNPFLKEEKLRSLIHQYCNQGMGSLLEHATTAYPNAKVAVVGYFPVVSTKSDINKVARYLFKAVKFPHPLQFTLTNPVSRQFLKVLRKKMAMRSRLWVAESNRETIEAIRRTNAKLGSENVVYVPSPITEDNCFGTKGTLLWETDKDNFPNDELYGVRRAECPAALSEIKYHHYGKLALRMCELAAIGHPNIEGSKAYAEAIKKSIAPLIRPVP